MSEDYKLPSNEHTFEISLFGDNTNQKFEGKFTYKRPTIGMQVDIQKTIGRMNGDLSTLPIQSVEDISNYNFILSTLKHCIVEAPKWFTNANNGLDLYDSNVIKEVFEKCMSYDADYKKKVFSDSIKEVKVEQK